LYQLQNLLESIML